MPSENELYLWWSGNSESVFLYYLTGAMAISFLATILITKSLRRVESRVIELLQEDHGTDTMVTYLLKITTSVMPGSSCPNLLKVFMQLKGNTDTSEFFQLRSKPCGKAIFQRGHTDIFIVTVPETLGEVQSVELLVSGLKGDLPWKFKDVQLYNPVNRSKKDLPATVTALEVLDLKSDNLYSVPTTSWKCWIIRNLLLYHQWLAMFGNTVRLGAFTELVHVLSVFMTLFSLMVLSQMFYITLPRGEFIPSPEEDQEQENDKADPGLFNVNSLSLLIAAVITSVCCSVLVLGLEILLRSVKSLQKDPGNAYYTICDSESLKFKSRPKTNIYSYPYNASVFFLPSCNFLDTNSVDIKSGSQQDNTGAEILPAYLPLLVQFLREEYEKLLLQSNPGFSSQYFKKSQNLYEYSGDNVSFTELSTLSSVSQKLPQWVSKHKKGGKTSIKEDSQDTVPEVQLFQQTSEGQSVSSVNLDQLMSIDSLEQGLEWSYFDHLANRTASQIFEKAENDSNLEQVVVEMPVYIDSTFRMHEEIEDLNVLEDLDADGGVDPEETGGVDPEETGDSDSIQENANESTNTLVDQLEESERFVDGVSSASVNSQQNKVNLKNYISNAWNEECVLSVQESSEEHILHDWESLLKTWSRELVKDLLDIIKSVREKLIIEKLDVAEITLMLLKKSQDVLQRLVVACYMQCSKEFYDVLSTGEVSKLMTHLSMEIMVTALEEIFVMLMKKGKANLVDLILRSHRIMQMLQFAAKVVVHVLSNEQSVLELVRCLIMAKDMHQLLTVLLHGCFDHVTTYNLVSWKNLKALVDKKLKGHLETTCYEDLHQYVLDNIQNESNEDSAVSRLCISVEEHAKQEIWEDLHNEGKIFTNVLIKCQLLRTLKKTISKLKKRKQKFDQDNDLLPKEPKSRLQRLVDKRRPTIENIQEELKQTFEKYTNPVNRTDGQENCKDDKVKKLEKKSKEKGQVIDNLSCIYAKLKKVIEKQGLTEVLNGPLLLAQATLHPCVKLHENKDSEEMHNANSLFEFDNILQFKRAETTLSNFFRATASELIQFLLKSVESQHNFKCLSDVDYDHIVVEILVKLDTLVDWFYEDLDNVMYQCIRTEQRLDKHQKIEVAAKSSAFSLIQKSSLIQWNAVDLSRVTPSEMLAIAIDFDEEELQEIIQYMEEAKITDMDRDVDVSQNAVETNEETDNVPIDTNEVEVNFLPDTVEESNDSDGIHDNEEDSKEDNDEMFDSQRPTDSIQEIINDLRPVKTALELLKQEEEVRSHVTKIRYIDRSKQDRDYMCAIQLNNIIDAYYMIGEGDDSHTLTSAGLYQLEHDCTSEDLKPLPPWVKVVTLMLMVVLFILITIYVTVIGGQFSTTDLQEWMCYYLLSIMFFGLILEPIRACIVGWYMTGMEHKMDCNRVDRNEKCHQVIV